MSLYNDASLLLIPSGYKSGTVYTQKPTDGSGDLTFTRASSATRVNSDGLIESPRTNLLLQSNTFDTTWTNLNTTETSGQSGYDGTSNAWLLEKSASSGYLRQTGLPASAANFSVFVKANDSDYVLLASNFGTITAYFDLQSGVVGNTSSGVIATISFIGDGWYRCSAAFGIISDVRIYPAENNVVTASSGSVFIQDAQLEVGDIATDYIPTTNSARTTFAGITQDGTSAANVPRLDYSQGSCPSLLLESQRTNLGINTIWAGGVPPTSWTLANSNGTISAVTSNLGTDATALSFANSGGGSLNIENAISYTATNYVISFYVESISGALTYQELVRLTGGPNITTSAFFLNGASVLASAQVQVGRVEYRFTLGTGAIHGARIGSGTGISTPTTNTIVISRPQFEQGAYATSYIPTTSATVTRIADACYKTGISSLIGQSEGTLFLDFVVSGVGANAINIYNNDRSANSISTNAVVFQPNGNIECQTFFGNGTFGRVTLLATGNSVGQRIKLGFRYKSGDFAVYVNGVQKSTDTTTMTFIGTKNTIELDNNSVYYNYQEAVLYNQFVQFPTALTNTELAALTTL